MVRLALNGALLAGLGLASGCVKPIRYTPVLPGTHVLRSGSLCVEVMDPKAPNRYNRGVRFSPVANVLRVSRHGRSYLAAPLAHEPLFENGGLAMEFDLTTPGGPPGFQEAAIGEGFVKLGVGVLRKHRPDYFFWPQYEAILLANTQVHWHKDTAEFDQVCTGINGYAYRLEATVRVRGDSVSIRYRLHNSGTKPFTTQQYAHNYFCFDGQRVGPPGYVLEFPVDVQTSGFQPEQRVTPREVFFEKEFVKSFNAEARFAPDYDGPNRVTVRHTGNGQQVVATTSIPGLRVAVHANPSALCPEQFVEITLAPGEKKTWTRTYTFTGT